MKRVSVTVMVLIVSCGVGVALSGQSTDEIPGEGENAAFDAPAKLAWRQFVFVNAPQGSRSGGAPVLWETWASAEETFADPDTTPRWPASARSGGSEDELVQRALFRSLARQGNETGDDRRVEHAGYGPCRTAVFGCGSRL